MPLDLSSLTLSSSRRLNYHYKLSIVPAVGPERWRCNLGELKDMWRLVYSLQLASPAS